MTAALTTQNDNLDQINAALRGLGLMEEIQPSTFNRAKMNGPVFELDDEVFPSNAKTKAPAFFARLVDVPLEYQGLWLTQDDADTLNRSNAADTYCKSYYHIPEQAGKVSEDGTSCKACPVNPYIKKGTSILESGKKCAWRGDVMFQRTDNLGQVLDDRVWSLSLSTTSMIELKGMRSKDQEKGFLSEFNTMQQLARLAIQAWPQLPVQDAVRKAGTMLSLGGVICGFRIEQAKSQDGSRSFPVVVITPVNIIELDAPEAPAAQLGDGNEDDLPF